MDRCPPDDEFCDLLKASERCDLPVRVGGWFYTPGRDSTLFERNIHKARPLGHVSCEPIVGVAYGAGHRCSTFDNNVACAR